MERNEKALAPRVFKAALFLCRGSVAGWAGFYLLVVILLFFAEDGHLAHQIVHPIACGYLFTGILGSWFMKKKGRDVLGSSILFWGYIITTCIVVVLAFPLFIPAATGFKWYIYVMLACLFAGIIGASLAIR